MKHSVASKNLKFSASPVLSTSLLPLWRSKFVVFLLFLAFLALIARAFWIQGPGNSFYQKQGESRYLHTIELSAIRGKILDRDGVILATSLPVWTIWAAPDEVSGHLDAPKLARLSQLLNIPQQQLRAKLAGDRNFVYLKRRVSHEIAEQVAALDIPGFGQRKEYQRFYPEGEITAHVVGFTNIEDKGQDGIELAQQQKLAGVPGSRRVIMDRLGRPVENVDELAVPRNGQDLVLALDSKIQYLVFSALKNAVQQNKAHAGSALVIDARTGEILALANYPSYNPNDRRDLTGAQLRNRVLTDAFEPGSIMKPITIALALDLHRISPDTLVNTAPGHFTLDGATITDDSDYGTLTVAGVIQKSSNIGTTKIAMQLSPQEMWNMFTSVGFGQAPRLGFPGAAAGRLRPWRQWRRIEQATMSYGYGISVSLLQIAHAYTIFAHHGQLIPLSLFETDHPASGPQIIAPRTADEMLTMLGDVAMGGGTAASHIHVPGYSVGGKTGTAYRYTAHGYDKSSYRASFVGIAPLSNPRVIIAVSIDDPSNGQHFGGEVAAPVFSQIVGGTLRSLNVAPDLPIATDVMLDNPRTNLVEVARG